MAVGVNDGLVIEYSKIFKEEPPEFSSYLKGISRDSLVTVGGHFLSYQNRHWQLDDFVRDIESILGETNRNFKYNLIQQIRNFTAPHTFVPIIICPESSLTFFEFAFNHGETVTTQTDDELRKSILLAYLVINDNIRRKEASGFSSVEHLPEEERIGALFFSQAYPYSNLVNYKEDELRYCQFVKAILFFELLERTTETRPLLESFIKVNYHDSWKTYLRRFIPLVTSIKDIQQGGFLTLHVPRGNSFVQDCQFLDQLVEEKSNYEIEPDFKVLRDRPLYKISEGVYRIIFSVFVYEKIYRSLYFRLASVNAKLPKEQQVKNLQSYIGNNFSEQTLMYKILETIYKGRHIKFPGAELHALGVNAEPDYYLRNGKKIFIFESKDFLIRADVKISFDYTKMEPEFRKRFVKDGSSNKAVLQLVHTIKSVLERKFLQDETIPHSIDIYPIIIIHDYQYDVVGLNKLVDYWFQEELTKLCANTLSRGRVRPVTIINIDSLIYHEMLFRERRIRLDTIIDAYHKSTRFDPKQKFRTIEEKVTNTKNKLVPFSAFLDDHIAKNGLPRYMSLLSGLGKRLYEQDEKEPNGR